jgi:hypothetical protein
LRLHLGSSFIDLVKWQSPTGRNYEVNRLILNIRSINIAEMPLDFNPVMRSARFNDRHCRPGGRDAAGTETGEAMESLHSTVIEPAPGALQ